jgi:hypothetical protein
MNYAARPVPVYILLMRFPKSSFLEFDININVIADYIHYALTIEKPINIFLFWIFKKLSIE